MLYDLFSLFHQIAQCVQAITTEKNEPAYVIQIPQFARFVSGLEKNVSAVDIDVGKRVAVTQEHYTIAVFSSLPVFIIFRKHQILQLMHLFLQWKLKINQM